MILRCRLCHAAIAAFDPARLTPPLSSAVFGPLAPGFPPPFLPDAPWDEARCPHCRHHPQGYDPAGRESLATDAGETPLPRLQTADAKRKTAKRGN